MNLMKRVRQIKRENGGRNYGKTKSGKNKASNSIDACINTAGIFRNRVWKNEFGKKRRADCFSNGNSRS